MKMPFQTNSGFIVIGESLGEIAAYYHKIKDQKLIHVNEALPEWYKSIFVDMCLSYARECESEFFAIMNNMNNVEHFKTIAAQ
jgi:hypothetical protein